MAPEKERSRPVGRNVFLLHTLGPCALSAFQAAGAKSVVATLCQIRDDAARSLMNQPSKLCRPRKKSTPLLSGFAILHRLSLRHPAGFASIFFKHDWRLIRTS